MEEVRLALCDDEEHQLAQTQELLRQYRALHPDMELTVTPFLSGCALLEHLRVKGTFDVYLLDVIMPGENGIDLGVNIREFDQGGSIVYLTTSPAFAVDSYRAKAAGYLLKPLEKEKLFALLDELAEQWLRQRQDFITIKTKDGLQRVALHTVVYGELADRCVQYHLADGSILEGMSVRASFQSAVQPLLEHRRFVLCSASFFVNLAYVKRVDATGLCLTDGTLLPLSRQLRGEVTDLWMDYYLEGGR